MPTRLILIRHGETDWNSQKRYCGCKDIGLNDKGIEQAKKLCKRLQNENVDKVYSSDLSRAFDFASIVFKNISVEKMPELREMNFGIFEGLTYEEIMKKHPQIYTNWLNNPFEVRIPEGDNLNDFKKRIEKALDKIISLNKSKEVAIVTHGGPIRIITGNILKPKDIWDIKPDLASISIVEFKNGKEEVVSLYGNSKFDTRSSMLVKHNRVSSIEYRASRKVS